MNDGPRQSPTRLLRFALRCGDDELADLLVRRLDRTTAPSPLAVRTYGRLAARLGIATAH